MRNALNRRVRTLLSASLVAGLFLTAPIGLIATSAQAATTVYLTDTDKLAFNKTNASYALSAITTVADAGRAVNDIVVYKNVGSFGGISIDCAVTTVAITAGSISNYDNNGSATTTGTYIDNFQLNTVGGEATFKFEFFKAGTYTRPGSGVPVVLQNVKITSIDLDSSGTNGFQYTDFTGFQKYSMMNPTNLGVKPLTSPNRVRFIATKTGARSSVPEDQVLVKYDSVQTIQMNFGNVVAGAAATNYYGLVFGGWPGAGIPTEYTNTFNAPPTSSDVTLNVAVNPAASVLPLSSFGNYADSDNNPFNQVKIGTISGGTLEYSSNGSTWATVTSNQVISVTDIEANKVRFTPTGGTNGTVTFYVQDGLDYSVATYTLTLVPIGSAQTITFSNPGTKAVSGGSFASSATASSNLTVALSSSTTGICTVNGLDIVPVAAGTCVITATQPGNGSTPAALPVTQSFAITATVLTSQTLTLILASPANKGATLTPTASGTTNKVSSTATAINSLNTLTSLTPSICTVGSSNLISYNAAGTCTIEANNPGDSTFAPATPVTASVTVDAPATTTQPIPTTLGAHTVNVSSATLTGMVDVNGLAATYRFCYATSSTSLKSTGTGSTSGVTCVTSASLTNSADKYAILTANISSLSNRTTYYYNISAWNSSGVAQYGEIFKFTTWSTSKSSRKRPMIQTTAPSSITNVDATLNGNGTADDAATSKVSFCISTSPSFSSSTYSISCNVSGEPKIEITGTTINTSATAVSRNTNDVLSATTVYYYQASITRTYSGSTTVIYGNIVPFTTSAQTQSVTTIDASGISTTSAVLNGSVNGYGVATTTSFLISSSSSVTAGVLDTATVTVSASPSSVSAVVGISITGNATGLSDGTRYYFQARATRDNLTYVYGPVKTFITGTPTVKTLTPSNLSSTVTPWSVDLNGYVNPNGTTATMSFCYLTANSAPTLGSDGSLPNTCTAVTFASGSDTSTVTTAFTKNITGLTAGATYYYQAVASSNTGTRLAYGEVLSFITVAPPTAVTTATPTTITSTGATLAGTATANGAVTDGAFCVSASNALDDNDFLINCELGVQDNESTLATTASGASITGTITGLRSLTTYYFQATAASGVGTGLGVVSSFTTLAGAPTPETLGATGVTNSAARLNGTVNPGGAETTVKFNYITDSAEPTINNVGKITTAGSGSVVTVTVAGTVASNASTTSSFYELTGLNATQPYYYQIEVTNSSGTAYGDVVSFSLSDPYAVTGSNQDVTTTTARVNGTGYKNGSSNSTSVICVSTSSDLDVNGGLSGCTTSSPVTLTNTSDALVLNLTGLEPGTTYYYQASATTSAGDATNYGSVSSFTTLFVVTFNGNGSSDTMTAMSGSTTTALTTNTMARSGYTFAGWNTVSGGTGTAYADGANFAFTSNVTLYAQWTAVSSPAPTPAPVYVPEPVREKEKPVVVWKNPNAIKFTTPLSTIQLNAQSTKSTEVTTSILDPKSKDNLPSSATKIPGSYTYIPLATTSVVSGSNGTTTVTSATGAVSSTPTPVLGQGTVLAPGLQKMKVIFTPTDTNTYEKVETIVEILVQADTKVEWKDPAPIKKTTPLSSTQLNAVGTAPGLSNNVPGTYKYDIPEGTTLAPGKREVKVIFTPTDPNYLPSEGKVTITVTADINPLATPIVTPANTPAAKPITNTTSAATTKVQTVGTGLTSATVNGTQVNVVPTLSFSGKTSVVVSVSDEGETKDVTVPVTVLPLAAVTPITKITKTGSSNISWKPSPNATSYEVNVGGKTVCATESTSCATNGLVGPKTPVQVIAKGNDSTVAPEAPAAYQPAAKPVTALVVYFNTNRSNLDAIDKAQIRSIAKVIIEQGFKNIVVNGHTDVMGGVDNQALSAARANTTFAYLKSLVPGLTVKIGAFASTKPAVKGSSAEALASNRRAEIGVF